MKKAREAVTRVLDLKEGKMRHTRADPVGHDSAQDDSTHMPRPPDAALAVSVTDSTCIRRRRSGGLGDE
jgi:hypothetical protein